MTPQEIKEVIDQLASLARETGEGGERLFNKAWPILVKKEYVSGMVELAVGLILFTSAICTFLWCIKKWRKAEDPESPWATSLLLLIPIITGLIVAIASLDNLLCPECLALDHLLTRTISK